MSANALRLPFGSVTKTFKYSGFTSAKNLSRQVKSSSRWLIPGLSIKRWLGINLFGVALGLWGLNYLLTQNSYGILAIALGLGMAITGQVCLIQSVVQACGRDRERSLLEGLLAKQNLTPESKIVAVGGGTGLSSILKGLKQHSSQVTAVVTVADDGGSSGRLREELGVLPPGDIRNCLAALSPEENLLTQLFQYRFTAGDGLEGHSFGNLFLTAMSEITGNWETAIATTAQILTAKGQVLPATLSNVRLWAELEEGQIVQGESNIASTKGKIQHIGCLPANPKALPQVIQAIKSADCIILGAGSLYTSIIPNLLIPEIRQAIAQAKVPRIYVCNIMTQPGETDDYTVADHIAAIDRVCGVPLFDVVVVNRTPISSQARHRYAQENSYPVILDRARVNAMGRQVVLADILDENPHTYQIRHHGLKLAQTLNKLVNN